MNCLSSSRRFSILPKSSNELTYDSSPKSDPQRTCEFNIYSALLVVAPADILPSIRACQESHIDMKMHRHALSLEISPMITRGKSWLALFDDCEERFSGLTAAIHNVSSNAGDRTAALADLWVACGQDQGSAAFKSLHHFWTDLKAAHSHVMRILRAVEMLQDALGESHIDRA